MNRKVALFRGSRAALLSLLLAALSASCVRSPDERGSGPTVETASKVSRLDPATLTALRDSFNAAEEDARILVMLSPT